MKRLLLTGLLYTAFISVSFAKPINLQRAQQIANNFLQNKMPSEEISLSPYNYFDHLDKANPEVYIFTNTNAPGFVIVSGDDAVTPILGYGTQHVFADPDGHFSPEVKYWIDHYVTQIAAVMQAQLKATPEIQADWDALSGTPAATADYMKKPTAGVNPLVTTTWGQWPVYNLECPVSPSPGYNAPYNQVPTGCVATAMAQIMKFWDYPATGQGQNSYNNGAIGGVLSANFSATSYDWSNMPNSVLNGSTVTGTQTEIDAIAQLMFHAGVSVEMNYKARSSGAYVFNYYGMNNPSAQRALVNNFKYSSDITPVERSSISTSDWEQVMQEELDYGRPFLYTGYDPNGAGHVWIVDGYNGNQFHMNWGWKGVANGYYTVADLRPTATGAGAGMGSYNDRQGILINIKPQNNTSPNPQLPAAFNLQVSTFNASVDSVHTGDAYRFSAVVKNTGGGDFSSSEFKIYLLALKDGKTNNAVSLSTQSHTIPAKSSYDFTYNTPALNELQPGYYVLILLYAPVNSSSGTPITNSRNRLEGYPLYVLPKKHTQVAAIKGETFTLYPNPANQWVNIKINNSSHQVTGYRLVDQRGSIVLKKEGISAQEVKLPTGAFANGIYSLEIITDEGVHHQKVLIQH